MRFIVLLSVLSIIHFNLASQIISHYDNEPFAFRVKQLDEFFERFNFENKALITSYIRENYPQANITRQGLLYSLFDREDTIFFPPTKPLIADSIASVKSDTQFISKDSFIVKYDTIKVYKTSQNMKMNEIDAFVLDVSDSLSPATVSFYDDNWFAELKCVFQYEGQLHDCTLIMKNQSQKGSNSSRWVIVNVSADFLRFPPSTDANKILDPAVHETDFIGLRRALDDKQNLRNYIAKGFEPERLSIFFNEIYKGRLQLVEIQKTTYHFLQINGWIFTLDFFNRRSNNSGWLISNLIKADNKAKTGYRKTILNLEQ